MGDPFRKVKTGDPLKLSATAWNAMLDIARGRSSGVASAGMFGAGRELATIVSARNDTGTDIDESYRPIGIGDPIYTKADNETEFLASRWIFKAESLEVPKHLDRAGIVLAPIKYGDVGPVAIAGAVPVRLWIRDQAHQFAEIIDTEYTCADPAGATPGYGTGPGVKLSSDHGGSFRIIWKDPGVAVPDWGWAIVVFPRSTPQLFRATEHANMTTFTVKGKPAFRDGAMANGPGAPVPTGEYTFQVACLEVTCANCAHRCFDFDTMNVTVSGFRDATSDSPTPGTDCSAYNGAWVLKKLVYVEPGTKADCGFSSANAGGSKPVGAAYDMILTCDDTNPSRHQWRLSIDSGGVGEGTIEVGEAVCGQGVYSLISNDPGGRCYSGGDHTTPQTATAVAELG